MKNLDERSETGLEIAVIGMSCRFPKANTVSQYWNNLVNGRDCVSRFSMKEMLDAGIPRHLAERPNYVKAKGIVSGIEDFDAEFFDYSSREAKSLDPQARLIHECVWEALENAGYCHQPQAGSVGLYVGGSTDQAWLEMLLMRGELFGAERLEAGLLGFKDSISTLTSYKLGLNGPSFTIYTACSTSALSVHLACRALLTGDCDIAAAGGASVYLPVRKGYLYEEGLTSSPDGKIRPFDEEAGGALFSDGAGIVVLKRLADAVSDGDHIHAVILGTASNNDGGRSVGYTAPSIEGQADVIRKAQEFAEVNPASISYIETHGTATQIGDTIEFEALRRVFPGDIRGVCALGSVKSNIGHLDTASGVASLIKVIMALKHAQIPPTINFERPNPRLNLIESPFYVAGELESWDHPVRRAGVSSFGFGGTNVHMVLQGAPQPPPHTPPQQPVGDPQIIPISARSEAALVAAIAQAQNYFADCEASLFADACFTFQQGRKPFENRAAIVASDAREASDLLARWLEAKPRPAHASTSNPSFELELGELVALVPSALNASLSGPFIRALLQELIDDIDADAALTLGDHKPRLHLDDGDDEVRLRLLAVLLAATFVRSLQRLGVRLSALHTFGAEAYLGAAIAAGSVTVGEALTALFHNTSLEGFEDRPAQIAIHAHALSVGGACAEGFIAGSKADHFDNTGLRLRLGRAPARSALDATRDRCFFDLSDDTSFEREFQRLVGVCWISGSDIRWDALQSGQRRSRVPVPTYPFQRRRLWLPDQFRSGLEIQTEKLPRIADWFTVPGWTKAPASYPARDTTSRTWLIYQDRGNRLAPLMDTLRARGDTVVAVTTEKSFDQSISGVTAVIDRTLGPGVTTVNIVHATSLGVSQPSEALQTGLEALVNLIKAIGTKDPRIQFRVNVVTDQAAKVATGDRVVAEKRAMLAPVKVAPQEHPNIRSRLIDVDQATLEAGEFGDDLLADLASGDRTSEIAYRAKQRWERAYEPIGALAKLADGLADDHLPGTLRKGGVYLITGGLGVVGLTMARYLARQYGARLVLVGRTGLPAREQWPDIIATTDASDRVGFRVRQVLELEALGAQVMVLAIDVCDRAALESELTSIESAWGKIHGVIHAAGILRVASAETPIVAIEPRDFKEQIAPKLDGLRSLAGAFENRDLDFRIAVSSLSPVLGGLGHVAYAAANLALDGYIAGQDDAATNAWLGVAWNDWQYVGPEFDKKMLRSSILDLSMTEREAEQTLECVTALGAHREIVISTGHIEDRIKQWVNPELSAPVERGSSASATDRRHAAVQFKAATSRSDIRTFLVELCREFFDVTDVDVGTNLFEMGATSLHVVQMQTRVIEALGRHVPIAIFFEHPTIALLADALMSDADTEPDHSFADGPGPSSNAVAIIGMAGRFPGADTVDAFWKNIDAGVPAITFFDRDMLLSAGVPQADLDRPDYVPAKGYLSGADEFDSQFFDYTPHDASIMDPQLRVFHECAWSAFEHAGYAIRNYPGSVGVFAGASPNLYWQAQSMLGQLSEQASSFEAAILTDKDSLTTQISYKFNLSGPSVTVFTGCSTSLVAIEAAYRAIVNGECDMCLAGGVTVSEPAIKGYIYEPGMAYSKDGWCRPFDDAASGMVFGDGVGAVVLKSLDRAIEDGDTIHAVIRGCAVNNDGRRKVGYTAPSVDGQADVMRMAHQRGGIDPASIGYIETHGTGTKLGDVVEATAIKKAFGNRDPLPIGSVKAQVGHLNAAAGVTGVLKAVQMLRHKVLPASLNFETPNQQCEFDRGPVFVNATRREWPATVQPMRIGVNSFGIGGTNAHAVLEEPPAPAQRDADTAREHVIVLSGATEAALDRNIANLAAFLKDNPDTDVSDLAYTLQVGRESFAHRMAFSCKTIGEACSILETRSGAHVSHCKDPATVVFMFSGNGGEYVDMARQFYETEPVFAQTVDTCLAHAETHLGVALKEVLYPTTAEERRLAPKLLQDVRYSQPLVFSVEYAMALLLSSWGVRPSVLIGYSLGEYVAAALAGVFELEDAMKIVCGRGELLSGLDAGAMISVPLEELECSSLIDALGMGAELSIAVDNGPSCVVAGEVEQIDLFEKHLRGRKILCMRVRTSIAAHSHLTRTLTDKFRQAFQGVALHAPNMTLMSGVTGRPLTNEEARDAEYWIAHLHSTIRFVTGLQTLTSAEDCIVLEVGPGRDMAVLAKRCHPDLKALWTISPQNTRAQPDAPVSAGKLAELWANGVAVDWQSLHTKRRQFRIPLPTYSFEKLKHKAPSFALNLANGLFAGQAGAIEKKPDVSDWFFAREWESMSVSAVRQSDRAENVLILAETGSDLAIALAAKLSERAHVVVVKPGTRLLGTDDRSFVFGSNQHEQYLELLRFLDEEQQFPETIIDCRSVIHGPSEGDLDVSRGKLHAALQLIKGVAAAVGGRSARLLLVTNRSQTVLGTEMLAPINASLTGLFLVAGQEIAGLRSASVDLQDVLDSAAHMARAADQIAALCEQPSLPAFIACRGTRVWQQRFKPAPIQPLSTPGIALRHRGVYLITGGLGGIGRILAEHLARAYQAKLVLTARPLLTDRTGESAKKHSEHQAFAAELEQLGAQVRIEYANVADESAMKDILERTIRSFGALNGVIHAAGLPSGDTFQLLKDITEDQCDLQFEAKQSGTMVLDRLLGTHDIDFALAMSSISTVLGGLGFAGYAPANIFMNAFIARQAKHSSVPWISVDWSDWKYLAEKDLSRSKLGESVRSLSIEPSEGIDCFERVVSCGRREVVHSPGDIAARIARWVERPDDAKESLDPSLFDERPNLAEPYAEPVGNVEETLATILAGVFRLQKVGVNDDFFDLGGDSLKGVTAVTRVHKQLGVEIPLTQLFDTPTIAGLAKYIESVQMGELQSVPNAPKQPDYALSFAQRRIYVVHELNPDSTAYNDPMIFDIDGELDVAKVEAAFAVIIQRHDSLRTRFEMVEDEPRQIINKNVEFSIVHREIDEAHIAEAIREFVKPFELASAPLMKTALFKIAPTRHLLVIDIHHIITDGVSSDRLMRDFVMLYRNLPLAPLKLQYKDFSEWQHSEAARAIATRHQPYWLETLADISEPASFPATHVGPERASFSGGSVAFELPQPLFRKLKKLTQLQGVTLFTGVMAAFKVLLARQSRRADLVVGTPVSGRFHPDLEDIVGMFVNILPVRSRYSGDMSFRDFLSSVGRSLAGAIDHQGVQYDELVRTLSLQGSLGKSPLFKVVVVQQRMDADHIDVNGLKIRPYRTDLRRALFDQVLNVFEAPNGVKMTLEYATDLYDLSAVERLVAQFSALLMALTVNPDDPIQAVDLDGVG